MTQHNLLSAVFLGVASLVVPFHSAQAGVITYTFANPNNNAGTLAIGFPLTPVNFVDIATGLVVPGFSSNYPVNGGGAVITTSIDKSVAAGGTETLATKQTKIANYITANLPAALMVGKPAANQVSITIPAATLAAIKKAGQIPGIGVMATNGVETEGFLKAKDDPTIAEISFDGLFSMDDQEGLMATFTAGLMSDLGAPSPLVLDPDAFSSLDGATIAETFYDDLMPIATSLGIDISYVNPATDVGDIFVYFPAGTATTNGGVVFGTTSATGTVMAGIDAETSEPGSLALLMAGLAAIGVSARHGRANRGS